MVTVLQMGLTPVVHIIAEQTPPTGDRVLAQFPRNGTLVERGAGVMMTITTDAPAKVDTYFAVLDGKVTVIDRCEAMRLAPPPDRPRPPFP
jgi:hypothetical protein